MSEYSIAHHHASISKHGAVAQMLCCCSLAKPDFQMTRRLYSYGIVLTDKNVLVEISVRSFSH